MSHVVVVVPHTVRLTNVRCHAHPVLIALYEAGDIRVGKPHLCRPVAKFASLPNGEGATGATAGFAVTSVVWAVWTVCWAVRVVMDFLPVWLSGDGR